MMKKKKIKTIKHVLIDKKGIHLHMAKHAWSYTEILYWKGYVADWHGESYEPSTCFVMGWE